MIPEPQRTYVLELWSELGSAAADFVLVGGQALNLGGHPKPAIEGHFKTGQR